MRESEKGEEKEKRKQTKGRSQDMVINKSKLNERGLRR